MHDATMSGDIQINLYEGKQTEIFLTIKAWMQVSLRDGPTDPNENREACLQWLDRWMLTNGILAWRWTRYKKTLGSLLELYIYMVHGIQIQGRVDYAPVYPQKAWISSSIFLPWSHPQREELMEWYRNIRDQQYSLFGECWLIMVHLDRRNQVGDHVLYIDYTCEARDETKEDFQQPDGNGD
jgi:hypothetical protein